MSDSLFDLLATGGAQQSRIYGVVTGVVTNNQDPANLGRVKLRFPWLSDTQESWWARIATPMAGGERGIYLLPEVDDEVLVAFEQGDVRFPYVLGALWSEPSPPPATNGDGENNLRVVVSRSGMVIRLDDSAGAEQIVIADKDAKNQVVIDVANNKITISADGDVEIVASSGKLKLSGSGVEIASQAEVKIEASGGMELSAGSQLKIKGSTVDVN
jgi:uncharacterized protein involved in type VI secretion and phage assembly